MSDSVPALRAYRIEHNLTLLDLAARLGVSKSTMIRYEREVPPEKVAEVEKKTGIPRAALCPRLFGNIGQPATRTQDAEAGQEKLADFSGSAGRPTKKPETANG